MNNIPAQPYIKTRHSNAGLLGSTPTTGGTSEGISKALEATKVIVDGKECSVKVAEYIFVVELNGLNGRERLEKIAPVYSIAHV